MQIYNIIFFFIIGSFLASFYNVVAKRIPNNESIIKPRSHCDKCKHILKWYDLIPILSFIFLKGRCRYCKEKISFLNLFGEVTLGVLFSIFYILYGFTYQYLILIVLLSLLYIIFVTDIKYMIILDSTLIVSSIFIFIIKVIYLGIEKSFLSILYGLILFIIMFLMSLLGKKMFKREALGGGDIKLSFLIGLTLDLQLGLTAIILSTFLALPYATYSLISSSSHEVAYGPFLISATFIVFLFSDKFMLLINMLFPLL